MEMVGFLVALVGFLLVVISIILGLRCVPDDKEDGQAPLSICSLAFGFFLIFIIYADYIPKKPSVGSTGIVEVVNKAVRFPEGEEGEYVYWIRSSSDSDKTFSLLMVRQKDLCDGEVASLGDTVVVTQKCIRVF